MNKEIDKKNIIKDIYTLPSHEVGKERLYCFDLSKREEIEKLHPENHQAWKNRDVSFQPKDGESLLQFDGRVVQAARRWAEEFKQHEIALVAHGGVLDCLHRAATQKPLEQARDFEILNASLSTLKYQDGQFSLIQWGDVSHLNDLQLSKSLDEVDGSPR